MTVAKGDAHLRITAMPGRHGPPLAGLVLPDVMGSLLEFQSPAATPLFRLYITGDTLVIDDLQEIPRRYPQIDLALLHLGGTRVLGILVTMDGKQGVQLMQTVAPQHAIPIHYNDYPYSDTCRTWSSITKVYGGVKHRSPLSLVPGKPQCYVGKFGQHTKVTL
jgi:L-ascorbate metabolism protein UlaG (beta-lactamase superfamily)